MRNFWIDWIAFLFMYFGYGFFCLDWVLDMRKPIRKDWIQMALWIATSLWIFTALFVREV